MDKRTGSGLWDGDRERSHSEDPYYDAHKERERDEANSRYTSNPDDDEKTADDKYTDWRDEGN